MYFYNPHLLHTVNSLRREYEIMTKQFRADEYNQQVDMTNPKDLIGSKKVPLSLIPPAGLETIGWAMKNGADKYGAYNWRDKKVQYMIYIDAMMRHLSALIDREDIAEDSKVHHLGHIGANCVILLDAIKNDCLVDNRPHVNSTQVGMVIGGTSAQGIADTGTLSNLVNPGTIFVPPGQVRGCKLTVCDCKTAKQVRDQKDE